MTGALPTAGARRERPRGRCASKGDYEFSPSDVDCHATLRWGHAHAMEGTISCFNRAVWGLCVCANDMARSQFSFASPAALWIFATTACPASSTGVS